MSRQIHVLDTSVLVHDPQALRQFRGTEVAIPIFVVMELDDLKNSRRFEVASSARMASRLINELRAIGPLQSDEGIHHPDWDTRFFVITDGTPTHGLSGGAFDALRSSTSGRKMDMLILKSALKLKERFQDAEVVLVSKDVNLRILADFEGLEAEDYKNDRVKLSDLYTGMRRVDDIDPGLLAQAYVPDDPLHAADVGLTDLCPNEFVIAREGSKEHVFRFDGIDGVLRPVPRDFARSAGITPRNLEQRMALSLLMDPDIQLVSMVGKAGTGKTFLALAAAIAQLGNHRKGSYDRILVSKPVVAMGHDIGFLPGDFDAKMQPWMMSFFDNLDQIIPSDEGTATSKGATQDEKGWEFLFHSGQLEVQAIHSIRGRSIPNAFMLIDEAQNLTPHEIKTIITRAAEGTKVVISGDPFQVDNHFLDQHSNGLVFVTEKLKESPMTGAVFFTKGERSHLAELAATLL